MGLNYRSVTSYFILAAVAVVGGYDIWVMIAGGKDASISQVMIDYAYEFPLFPFITGVLMGHLFWRMPERKK